MEDEFGPVASTESPARLGTAILRHWRHDHRSSAAARRASGRNGLPKAARSRFAFAPPQEFEDLLLALGAARSGLGVALAPTAADRG